MLSVHAGRGKSSVAAACVFTRSNGEIVGGASTTAPGRPLLHPDAHHPPTVSGLRAGGSAVRPVAPVRMAVAVMGGAQQPEIAGFGAAAEREPW